MFVKLTDEIMLPRLSARAAIELLELEVFFLPASFQIFRNDVMRH